MITIHHIKLKMTEEKLSISFTGFETHLSATLDENFSFSHFTDVTLVSDDNKQFTAHKIVLSACSPILSIILLNHPHPEPIIFFKSVKHEQLQAMLDYMYLGTVSMAQDRVKEWFSTAEELKIKGLCKKDGFNGKLEYDVHES